VNLLKRPDADDVPFDPNAEPDPGDRPRLPLIVLLPLIGVFVAGGLIAVLGAGGRTQDQAPSGLPYLLVGLALLVAATGCVRGGTRPRTTLIVLVTLTAVAGSFVSSIAVGWRLLGLVGAAAVVALLVYPPAARRFFGSGEQPPDPLPPAAP